MRKINSRKGVILTVFIIGGFLFVLFYPYKTALVFYYQNTDELTAYLPLNKQDEFQFIFTHSIHLTDVVESYEILDDLTIQQNEIIYEEFGIGMPSNALDGEVFEYIDGKYHISNLNNVFEEIKIRNGKTVSNNRLGWKGEEIPFNDYFQPGDWFTVKVEYITWWKSMKGAKINE